MRFFLDINPPTATSQENKTAVVHGRLMHYKSKRAKATFETLTRALKPFAPAEPLDGPIRLVCEWRFPRGKSHWEDEWKITRPDTDNLQKALKDVMTRLGYWVDDSRVCAELVTKRWSDHPGIWIIVEPIAEIKKVNDDGTG